MMSPDKVWHISTSHVVIGDVADDLNGLGLWGAGIGRLVILQLFRVWEYRGVGAQIVYWSFFFLVLVWRYRRSLVLRHLNLEPGGNRFRSCMLAFTSDRGPRIA
ncbi:hypothetical protein BDW69DRAFT_176135 [Aspergillus filifer]